MSEFDLPKGITILRIVSSREFSKRMINRNGQETDKTNEKGLWFTHVIGMAMMHKRFFDKRTYRKPDGSTYTQSGWKNLSDDLNLTCHMTEKKLIDMIRPIIENGNDRVYLYTKCAKLGLSDAHLEGNETAYGFKKNEWIASRRLPIDNEGALDFSYVQKRLKKLGSQWRIRTKFLSKVRVFPRELWD